MTDYDNELRGALFKNDKKGNDKAPDYKGTTQIQGVEYEVAGWLRTSRNDVKYMSLKYEEKRARSGGGAPVTDTAIDTPTTRDEDIPF